MAKIKENKNKEKVKYKTFSMRLHDDTILWLKHERNKSTKSWNRFLIELLKNNMK